MLTEKDTFVALYLRSTNENPELPQRKVKLVYQISTGKMLLSNKSVS